MAKTITELTAAGAIAGADLLWLEQSGLPRKVTMTEVATFTGGGLADGTGTDNTLRWSGSAWVENAVAKITSAGAITALSASVTGFLLADGVVRAGGIASTTNINVQMLNAQCGF